MARFMCGLLLVGSLGCVSGADTGEEVAASAAQDQSSAGIADCDLPGRWPDGRHVRYAFGRVHLYAGDEISATIYAGPDELDTAVQAEAWLRPAPIGSGIFRGHTVTTRTPIELRVNRRSMAAEVRHGPYRVRGRCEPFVARP